MPYTIIAGDLWAAADFSWLFSYIAFRCIYLTSLHLVHSSVWKDFGLYRLG